MIGQWKKLGHIFVADRHYPWMQTHAANPVARHLGEGFFRIYFSCRDAQNRSGIGTLEIDIDAPTEIVSLCAEPVLLPGEIGAFDDSGVSMGCLVEHKKTTYLYYMGWNLGVTVPWRNSIGMAIEQKDGRFVRYSQAPILDRNTYDPFTLSYPFVLKEGELWRMWYGSNLKWGTQHSDMDHVIKYAESKNGIHWKPSGKTAIGIEHDGEYAFARPCILKDNYHYHMWYAYRGDCYQIGDATSKDGYNWSRNDRQVTLSPSEEGWDSQSVAYPYVFKHGNNTYMLYTGNNYGREGFGIAILLQEN